MKISLTNLETYYTGFLVQLSHLYKEIQGAFLQTLLF